MRRAFSGKLRFIGTPAVSKHRIFVFLPTIVLPDHQLYVFARSDDYFFGVLHSRLHEVWALKLGTRLETRPRYTPTTCFETFPFPEPSKAQEAQIAEAAKEIDTLRSTWLNPPEWVKESVLEFPASADGPWKRHVVPGSPNKEGIGVARYVRFVPKDMESAGQLKKRTLTNLYNESPEWLKLVHRKLDEAVAAAYGWPADLSDDKILKRLLEINLARA